MVTNNWSAWKFLQVGTLLFLFMINSGSICISDSYNRSIMAPKVPKNNFRSLHWMYPFLVCSRVRVLLFKMHVGELDEKCRTHLCIADGKMLAVGSRDNYIYVYNISDDGKKYSRHGRCSVSTHCSSYVTNTFQWLATFFLRYNFENVLLFLLYFRVTQVLWLI